MSDHEHPQSRISTPYHPSENPGQAAAKLRNKESGATEEEDEAPEHPSENPGEAALTEAESGDKRADDARRDHKG